MASDETSPTFHRFPQLPLEIRRMIWKAALPDPQASMMAFFAAHREGEGGGVIPMEELDAYWPRDEVDEEHFHIGYGPHAIDHGDDGHAHQMDIVDDWPGLESGNHYHGQGHDEDEDEDLSSPRPLCQLNRLDLLARFEAAKHFATCEKLVELPVPHLYINSEARQIGLKFTEEQQLKRIFREETKSPVLVRRFFTFRDTMYVPYAMWMKSRSELAGMSLARFDPSIRTFTPELKFPCRLAVPEALALRQPNFLGEVLSYTRLDVIYIIFDRPPELGMKMEEFDFTISRPWDVREITEEQQRDVQVRQFEFHGEEGGHYATDGVYHDWTYVQQRIEALREPVNQKYLSALEVLSDFSDMHYAKDQEIVLVPALAFPL